MIHFLKACTLIELSFLSRVTFFRWTCQVADWRMQQRSSTRLSPLGDFFICRVFHRIFLPRRVSPLAQVRRYLPLRWKGNADYDRQGEVRYRVPICMVSALYQPGTWASKKTRCEHEGPNANHKPVSSHILQYTEAICSKFYFSLCHRPETN